MTLRLHILDTPWTNMDLLQWWRWQRDMDRRDPNYTVSNPAYDPRYVITEKRAFGVRMLLFWRRIYQRRWVLGSSLRGTSLNVGRRVWSCGMSEDPVFRNPATRDDFIQACSRAVALAKDHYHLQNSALSDGAVRFHAFSEFCSQADRSAFQESYSPGISEQAPQEADDIAQTANTFDPATVAYAPVARINSLFSTSILNDWAITAAEEGQVMAILFGVLMYGVDDIHAETPAQSQGIRSSPAIETIRNVRDRICVSPGARRDLDIPVINVREFHRVLLYCNAGRLYDNLEDHSGGPQYQSMLVMLWEIMDNCIQRRCLNANGTPWLSLSDTLRNEVASHLLY